MNKINIVGLLFLISSSIVFSAENEKSCCAQAVKGPVSFQNLLSYSKFKHPNIIGNLNALGSMLILLASSYYFGPDSNDFKKIKNQFNPIVGRGWTTEVESAYGWLESMFKKSLNNALKVKALNSSAKGDVAKFVQDDHDQYIQVLQQELKKLNVHYEKILNAIKKHKGKPILAESLTIQGLEKI